MTRFYFRVSFLRWLRAQWRKAVQPAQRKLPSRGSRLTFDLLEDRVVPASLSDSFGFLTITLDTPNETLTISGQGSSNYTVTSSQSALNAGLTGATFNSVSGLLTLNPDFRINIIDDAPGAAVNFGKGDAGAYDFSQSISVDLSNPLSGNVAFTGTGGLTFEQGLSVTTQNGSITQSSAASTINVNSDLNLTASEGAITLMGAVNDSTGFTTLDAAGAISAGNAANNFGGSLTLGGPQADTGPGAASASVTSAVALELNSANIAGALTVTVVSGDLTENGDMTVNGAAGFNATAGNVFLDNFSSFNIFGGDVSASVSVSGTNDIQLGDSSDTTSFQIGTITLGSGDLTLDQLSFNEGVTEDPAGGGIITTGNVNVTLNASQDVLLGGMHNSIAGLITVQNNDFGNGNFSLWNTSSFAAVGQLNFIFFQLDSLTLQFDNASIGAADFDNLVNLPTLNGSFTALTLTAQSITEDTSSFTDAVDVAGAASFDATVGGVSLGNTSNLFDGDISAAVTDANDIQIDNSTDTTTLGNITLGTGNLIINDDSTFDESTITEDPMAGGITTAATSAGAVAINIANDTFANIDLSNPKNSFVATAGLVAINGVASGSEGNFGLATNNTFAGNSHNGTLDEVAFTNFTIDNLTVVFSGAGVNADVANLASSPLPLSGGNSLTSFTALSVTAGGNITQSAAITTSDIASFTVLGSTSNITLANAGNNVFEFELAAPAAGTGTISLANSGSVSLGTSALGKTTFTATANGIGGIFEANAAAITQSPGAPAATFAINGTGTAIDLSVGHQNFFAATPIFTENTATLTTINVEDANPFATVDSFITHVHGISVAVGSVFANLNITLDGATSSALLSTETIAYDLSVTATNDIALPSGIFTVTGSHDLTLISVDGNINLLGQLAVGDTTTLYTESHTGNANNITATNANNSFGTLDLLNHGLAGGTVAIVSANTLTFGASNLQAANLTATANAGAIQQSAAINLGGTASFITGNGAINLSNNGNTFFNTVSASTDTTVSNGNGAITLVSFGSILLGSISPQLGAVSVTAPFGISESPGFGGIVCAAASTATLSFTVGSNASISLSAAPNNITGPNGNVTTGVNISITGAFTTADFSLRNVSPYATMSQVALHSFTIRDLSVEFDNASISYSAAVPALVFSNHGNLALTAGGNITQISPIVTTGSASFNLESGNSGDGSILITNASNNIAGTVSFSAPNADNKQQINFVNNGTITLGSANLGLASFTLTANNIGSIFQTLNGVLTQQPGGGAITLNAAGNTIDLGNGGNDMTGLVSFISIPGGALTTVNFANADPLATLPTLTRAAAIMTSVSYDLSHAPVALGNISTVSLNVAAGGNIVMQSGATLVVSGEATFNTGEYGIKLIGNIHEISLNNSGESPVSVINNGPLILDDSFLGSGPLTISAVGPITESGNAGIHQQLGPNDAAAGAVSFAAGANPILLDNPHNELLGPISVNTVGAAATLVNSTDTLLGQVLVGSLSVIASSSNITQAPGSVVFVSNGPASSITASFIAGGDIDLNNTNNNSFSGAVSLDAPGGATLAAFSNISLAYCATSFLNVTSTRGITQLPGLLGSADNGVINATGATFTSGGAVTLNNAGNDFNDATVSLNTPVLFPGAVSLTDSDPDGLQLGQVAFGTAGLTLIAAGNIAGLGPITGTGPVVISSSPVSPISLFLMDPGNNFTGASITLTGLGNVSIANQGNLEITGTSTLDDSSQLTLDAGGIVTLPHGNSGTLTLGNLSVSANQINNINTNITATDVLFGGGNAISLTGAVQFMGSVTLNISTDTSDSEIFINGNVSTTGPITADLPESGSLVLGGGVWTQTAGDNLTVNGPDATLDVQSGATLDMAAGDSIIMTGEPMGGGAATLNNTIAVEGTLKVEGALTLSDFGTGSILAVNFDGTLLDSLGATVGVVTLNGANASDRINLGEGATLSGFGGLAPAAGTPIVQVGGGGTIVGSAGNLANQLGQFLMGTDIVTSTQTATTLSIKQASANNGPNATFVGNEPDGDKVTVTASGAPGLSLAVIFVNQGTPNSYAGMDIVVRGANANTTLTITPTANGGDGFALLNGIAIDGSTSASTTISAALANMANGNITTAGPLTSLTLRNWTGGTLQAGGTSSNLTTITGRVFQNVNMTLGSKLNMLTLAADQGSATITAASFGTIAVNGLAAANIAGNFGANLVNSPLDLGAALTSATIAGTLSGQWELAGTVGTVTIGTAAAPGATSNWSLGVPNGPGVANAGYLRNITSLSLGVASNIAIFTNGNVGTFTAISVSDNLFPGAGSTLQASSFGTINITGNAMLGDHGNFAANVTATFNSGGTTKNGIGTLTVAGALGFASPEVSVLVLDGNIGSITVGGQVNGIDLNVQTGQIGIGNIGTITAGAWQGGQVNANNVTTWMMKGNLAAHLFGFFNDNSVTLTGTLGTFSASGDVGDNSIEVQGVQGNGITSFTVGGTMSSTFVTASAAIGAITAGEWNDDEVTAQTIGTLKSVGRPAANAATSALNGDIFNTTITAFELTNEDPGNPAVGIGTLSATGNISNDSSDSNWISANKGIGSFSAGRAVDNVQLSTQLGSNQNSGPGNIGTLTAGAWLNSDLAANSLGAVNITGYSTPELSGGFVPGNVSSSNFIIAGAGPTGHGINSMTVQRNLGDFNTGVFFNVPAGIGTLTVGGAILGPSFQDSVIDARNPLSGSTGAIGTISAGEIENVNLYANDVTGGISLSAKPALGLNGDFFASTLAVGGFSGPSTAPVGVTMLNVAGNLGNGSTVEVADGMGTFSVGQTASQSTIAVAFDPVHTAATLKTLSFGTANNLQLVAGNIGTFNVTGNANFGLAGAITNSTITITGSLAGVGLGTFTAAGAVQRVAFHVTSGNVTSFKSAEFIGSDLLLGYAMVDVLSVTDLTNNGLPTNWELGSYTLGSFTTTAVLNNANPGSIQATAGFQTSDVVAAKLGTVSLSGLNPTPLKNSQVLSFGFGYRTGPLGQPATSFTLHGVTVPPSTSNPVGGSGSSFFYLGITG